MDSSQHEELPCHICGGQDFTWGFVSGYGGNPTYFLPREPGLRQIPANLIGQGSRRLKARECNNCNNVQLFSES